MKRFVWLSMALLVGAAWGRGNTRAEAQAVVDQLATGAMGLNQAVNRLEFLEESAWAANELTQLLRRAPDVRKRGQLVMAIAALAMPGDEDVEKALIAALRTDDISVRLAATRGLGKMKSERALVPLQGLLKDPASGLRREASRALAGFGGRAAASMVAALKAEEDVETRAVMLVALGKTGDRKQAAVLAPFLKDGSETTRLAAAQGLCALGDGRGVEFAKGLLSAKVLEERLMGIALFEGLKVREAAPLQALLKDPEAKVRARAARVLVQAGDRPKLAWLVKEAAAAEGETKLVWEEELEKLHLSDEDRAAWLKKGP